MEEGEFIRSSVHRLGQINFLNIIGGLDTRRRARRGFAITRLHGRAALTQYRRDHVGFIFHPIIWCRA
jgi:ABC-type lipoprotein export system ATPase subunit